MSQYCFFIAYFCAEVHFTNFANSQRFRQTLINISETSYWNFMNFCKVLINENIFCSLKLQIDQIALKKISYDKLEMVGKKRYFFLNMIFLLYM